MSSFLPLASKVTLAFTPIALMRMLFGLIGDGAEDGCLVGSIEGFGDEVIVALACGVAVSGVGEGVDIEIGAASLGRLVAVMTSAEGAWSPDDA